jgi:ubiquinone/menaquinone biosynthesis C-methylase UbiE
MSRPMKVDSSAVWERFAAAEPLFAVLTHSQYLSAQATPRSETAFFESGEQYVASTFEFIRGRLDPHFTAETILEFGCGPGRLAIPFSRRVRSVTAVDISPAMIARAQDFANRYGAAGIEFKSLREFASGADEPFDLVNCHLVLQRMSQAEGLELLRMLLPRVGEIGVFQMPYRSLASRATRLSRWVRGRVPGANALANRARGKSARTPFQQTTIYDLNAVLATMLEAGFEKPQVILSSDGDLDSAQIFVRRSKPLVAFGPQRGRTAACSEPRTEFINVRELIASTSIEKLNETAEAYFSGLTTWEHHLSKPFSNPSEAPPILINLAVLLQGLQLRQGMTVLDFGAGTGWLSRFLTQLGCRMILTDVSPTALRIARETYSQIGVVGDRPEPSFVLFDGWRIDLPDQSVDRIVSFDAFHHAPNPEVMLREFGRILRPGGIAGFAEPGPTHSQTAQSQFEMRTYRVLENDLDLPAIWKAAQTFGFTDLKVAAFNVPPFHTTLAEYEDLLAGREPYTKWAETTREFLKDVRDFFLIKGGTEPLDSRQTRGLRAEIAVEPIADVVAGRPLVLTATVTNVGDATWLPSSDSVGAVSLGCHLYDASGLRDLEFGRTALSSGPIEPDQKVTVSVSLRPLEAGEYRLEFDCVAAQVMWFAQVGSRVTSVSLKVR